MWEKGGMVLVMILFVFQVPVAIPQASTLIGWLKELDFEQYLSNFRDSGFDTLARVRNADDEVGWW
jgi:hypothetical protein